MDKLEYIEYLHDIGLCPDRYYYQQNGKDINTNYQEILRKRQKESMELLKQRIERDKQRMKQDKQRKREEKEIEKQTYDFVEKTIDKLLEGFEKQ